MKKVVAGFLLDFRRVFSRRVSGNRLSVLLELVFQPLVVAVLVFVAFLNRDEVDPFKLNFLYFSTLYAFWVGMFGACQSINSEVRSGEWCYWVLGLGRSRTMHVFAIVASALLFAVIQCLVFLVAITFLSAVAEWFANSGLSFNHFTDMFVATPDGDSSVDPVYQMNGVLWYVLSAKMGVCGPSVFASVVFALSLGGALLSGGMFGLLFGAVFRDPATSLNMAVGFIVLLGMMSYCGLRGNDGGDVGVCFAPLHDRHVVEANVKEKPRRVSVAVALSYCLPQRYFFNIGQMTFDKEWSENESVQRELRNRLPSKKRETETNEDLEQNPFKPLWMQSKDGVNFNSNWGIGRWIENWGNGYPPADEMFEGDVPTPTEMISFLQHHPEHMVGWNVMLNRKELVNGIVMESLPLLILDLLCLFGTLLSVWRKPCYQELR